MITNKTAREFVIAKKLFPDISTSVIETDTVTGAIASFETNMSAPIVNGVFEFNPYQEGTGDPSPSNPRPITGFTGLNVTRTGANVYNPSSEIVPHSTYGFFNLCPDNVELSIQLFDKDDSVSLSGISFGFSKRLTEDGAQSEVSKGFKWIVSNGNDTGSRTNAYSTSFCDQFFFHPKTQETLDAINARYYINIVVGSSVPTTYTAYQGTTYPISWQTEAGTVYGGELNATTGELKPFKEYDSYNGETLVGPWLCSQAPYVAGTTPPTGSQVVDLGAYDTTVQLTPQEVRTLLGENNIYHNANGNSSITYQKKILVPTTTDKRQFLPLIYGKKYYRKEY